MERYKNLGGDSGIVQYEYGEDYIRVCFDDGGQYLYTDRITGVHNIEKMKGLANIGQGLNEYINRHVRKRYTKKEK